MPGDYTLKTIMIRVNRHLSRMVQPALTVIALPGRIINSGLLVERSDIPSSEPGDEKVRKMLEAQIGMSMNTFVNVSRAKDIIEKLHRRERKTMGGPAITREEQALRTRIKNLEKFYEKLSSRPGYPDLKGFGWDPELVKMFLLSRPTKIELSYVFSGLYPFTSTSMNWRKRRDLIGYVPNPDKPGIFKHDKQKYIELLKSEIKMRNEVMNHILKREEEPTPEPEIKDEDKGASIVIATKSNKKKRKIP